MASTFRFDRVAAAGIYDGVLRSAILRYKFHQDQGVLPLLADAAAYAARRPWIREDVDAAEALVPVPQHWIRGLWRGWNPVAELAEALQGVSSGVRIPPVRTLLRKARRTPPQVELSGSVRRRNLQGAFAVRRGESPPPRRVILFDDVLTTGTTASECAGVLKRAGVESVVLLTLARSVTD